MFFIESSEVCICTECKGILKYRDKVSRIQKQLGGEKKLYMINRLKCEGCGRLHRQLTDGMVKFKHYSSEVIEDVLDGVITEKDPIDYPCDGSMKHWRWWFEINEKHIEGQMRSAGHRLYGFIDGFLKPVESLLDEIRERISPGWLGTVCRIVNNTGGSLLTKRQRFCTDFCSMSFSEDGIVLP